MGTINQPQFPLYIPSKGRSQYMITSKVLTELGVPHFIVVEKQDLIPYQEAIDKLGLLAKLVELHPKFKTEYELCDDLGLTKSTGPGPARNCAWSHSMENGHKWHWVMDDNIRSFRRMNKNEKVKVSNGAIFRAMEDFALRYKNVGMVGPNYYMFAPARTKQPPFITNTRIYSCNLIRNEVPYKWRGRYNEDTIISLDMLKAGWCTIQYNAFLQEKMATQALKGGNTGEFYHAEGQQKHGQKYATGGTNAKSEMQVKVHPDVSKIVWKFNRVHHHVDYSGFRKLKLIKKDTPISNGVNNYGMELKENGRKK